MAHERIKPEFLFDEEKIKQLKQIAPECFEDGKINFETLRQNLGDWAQDEEDGELEHFGLFWPGKKKARKAATIQVFKTLQPEIKSSLNKSGESDGIISNSNNVFIEGDNLDVLKTIQKSYANKIKVIYIDPPYNTGKDFVYSDDFTETEEDFLKRTKQIDEEGKALTTNKKSDGRFHSKWLSMMYPRLRIAHSLLRDDGIIYCNIDDNEVHNLRALFNEVFGEENFICQLVWNLKSGTQAGHFTRSHEYVLTFAKNKDLLPFFKDRSGGYIRHGALKKISTKNPASEITFQPGIEFEGRNAIFEGTLGSSEQQILKGKMVFENGVLKEPVTIEAGWAMKDQVLSWMEGKDTFDSKGQKVTKFWFNNSGMLWYEKERGTFHPKSVTGDKIGNTKEGTEIINGLFGKKLFDYAKPVTLVKSLLDTVVEDGDIILDFFAGSGTTGHATLELNQDRNINARYILVQLDEKIDTSTDLGKNANSLGYEKVSEITRDRLKLISKKYPEIDDSGFKSFRLVDSNYKKWKDIKGKNISQLENTLDFFNSSPLREDWNKNKLLTELMLLEGFPLDALQTRSQIGSNEIVKVESEMVPNTLLICLDDEIEESLIDELELDSASTFICLDSAISNQNKLRLSDKGLIKTI